VMRSTAGRWRRHCSSWRKTIGRVGPGWAAPGVARPERNLVGAKLHHGKRKKKTQVLLGPGALVSRLRKENRKLVGLPGAIGPK
jgi:hypothetical protein